MTRPSDIKPREGDTPGTPYAAFVEGAALGPVSFDITPAIVQEYFEASQADPALYRVDGRQAAAPNVILPYMTVPVYQTYPPIQGIVMAELEISWHRPIWADETTRVTATGTILRKFEKRGRRYVQWEGRFRGADGQPIATLLNTFHVPE
ncbi:PaaI family thioesterase [Bordetella bronchiseptica]|uniref:PaaI family thioesterase n=1 Tax=Bordetella bronchiseptica TaxID=518 RepID=UPI0002902CE9|nr:hypothetical protein [Bordetella bronchiseptica]KAK71299.1 dehydratase MaoC metal-binding domain protein [Bordetella bronchiseptica MO211]CCN19526.1 hypothetical protein BN114_3514 [Bordetella bronchiseptica MO211]